MKPLPPMRRLRVLRLSREGGVAALPGLRRPCAIRLEDCEPPAREALCALLDRALSDAVPEERAGRGEGDAQRWTEAFRRAATCLGVRVA